MSAVLNTLFSTMEILVLERTDEGYFHVLSTPPQWIDRFVPGGCMVGSTLSLVDYFLVLDSFLPDAEVFWRHGNEGRLVCDSWVQDDPEGRQWAFSAQAMNADGHAVLLLEHLGERYEQQQQILQNARENTLTKEFLEQEVRRRTAMIRQREEEVALRLLDASDWRDKETGAHIRRIGLYAEVMTRALGWDVDAVDTIRLAAAMHDIGKIGIPDEVLLKPGRFATEERTIMKRHAMIGASLLATSNIPMIEMGREIAAAHHEQWNGLGYPNQLVGDDIPIAARIVAIVDVYDALSSDRKYKPAWPEEEVIAWLQQERGKHFDPDLIDLFLELLPKMREIRLSVPDEND